MNGFLISLCCGFSLWYIFQEGQSWSYISQRVDKKGMCTGGQQLQIEHDTFCMRAFPMIWFGWDVFSAMKHWVVSHASRVTFWWRVCSEDCSICWCRDHLQFPHAESFAWTLLHYHLSFFQNRLKRSNWQILKGMRPAQIFHFVYMHIYEQVDGWRSLFDRKLLNQAMLCLSDLVYRGISLFSH